jgi:hypothetical protein
MIKIQTTIYGELLVLFSDEIVRQFNLSEGSECEMVVEDDKVILQFTNPPSDKAGANPDD